MIIKKIEEFEENGYTILEDVIPQNEVQLLNLELQDSADKFGKNNNGVTYLATTITTNSGKGYYCNGCIFIC